jgi:hypothetical protein
MLHENTGRHTYGAATERVHCLRDKRQDGLLTISHRGWYKKKLIM